MKMTDAADFSGLPPTDNRSALIRHIEGATEADALRPLTVSRQSTLLMLIAGHAPMAALDEQIVQRLTYNVASLARLLSRPDLSERVAEQALEVAMGSNHRGGGSDLLLLALSALEDAGWPVARERVRDLVRAAFESDGKRWLEPLLHFWFDLGADDLRALYEASRGSEWQTRLLLPHPALDEEMLVSMLDAPNLHPARPRAMATLPIVRRSPALQEALLMTGDPETTLRLWPALTEYERAEALTRWLDKDPASLGRFLELADGGDLDELPKPLLVRLLSHEVRTIRLRAQLLAGTTAEAPTPSAPAASRRQA